MASTAAICILRIVLSPVVASLLKRSTLLPAVYTASALRPRVFLGHPHPARRARRDVETVGRRSSLGIHAARRPPLEHLSMSRTRIHTLSISLDGFATGAPQSAEPPSGDAGERLTERRSQVRPIRKQWY